MTSRLLPVMFGCGLKIRKQIGVNIVELDYTTKLNNKGAYWLGDLYKNMKFREKFANKKFRANIEH